MLFAQDCACKKPGTEKILLVMLQVWKCLNYGENKFIYTVTVVLHLLCSVIALSLCVDNVSLFMHTNDYCQLWLKAFSATCFAQELVCWGVYQHHSRCRLQSKSFRQSLQWVGGLFAIDTLIDCLSWECTLPTNWCSSFYVESSNIKLIYCWLECDRALWKTAFGVCELRINCLVSSWFIPSEMDSPTELKCICIIKFLSL